MEYFASMRVDRRRLSPLCRAALAAVAAWLSASVQAGEVRLAWDASNASNVAGYYVHYGTASRSYAHRLDAGKALAATVEGLTPGQTWYFAVTAYSGAGEQSPFSNEAYTSTPAEGSVTSLVSSPNPAAAGVSISFTATVTGSAPTGSVRFTADGSTIPGCGSRTLTGSGNARTATCATSALALGNRQVSATYAGNAANLESGTMMNQSIYAGSPPLQRFGDVPIASWTWPAIEAIAAAGITLGCSTSPPSFCPDQAVRRDAMAAFLARAVHGPGYGYAATGTRFADVPASHPFVGPIEQVYLDGITLGCALAPLRYCPDSLVTRAQMAAFLLRAKFGPAYVPPAATGAVFSDVPASHGAAAWIERFASLGYTTGCASTPVPRYCPDQPVTRAAMAVFLQRVFELD